MTNIEKPTLLQIEQHYKAMGHSVDLINGIINNTKMINEDPEDKVSTIKRNVEHLEIMIAKDYWTNENMTTIEKAIKDGKSYLTK